MAKRKKQGISAQKKVHKVFLDNPWSPHWPTITIEQEQLIIEEIERLPKKEPADVNAKMDRTGLILGLNAVTRALEKDQLSGVLLGGGIKPTHLVQHVVPLCASRSIPVVCHRRLNTDIAKMIDISSLATLGIKRNAGEITSPLNRLLLLIQRIAPPLPSFLKNLYCKATIPMETESPKKIKPKYSKPVEEISASNSTAMPGFLSLSKTSCNLPLVVVPSELDTLSIRITDPNMDLESEAMSMLVPEATSHTIKKKIKKTETTLVPAKLKLMRSSGRKQKPKKGKKT